MAKVTLASQLAAAMDKIAALELAIAQREETISNQDDELESVLIENRALEARLVVAATVYRDQRARIAELESRLVVAATVCRNRRAKIDELEAQLNTRGVKTIAANPRPAYVPAPPTAETLAWRAYSAEQSELAKSTGKSVKMMSRAEFSAWFAEQAVMPETA